MTQLGLDYLKYQESKRSNLANEGLKGAQNVETKRSNLVNESIKQGELAEKERSNRAGESLKLQDLKETGRHNLITESISQSDLEEKQRSNLVKEAETKRSAIAKENQSRLDTLLKHQLPVLKQGVAWQLLLDDMITGDAYSRHGESATGVDRALGYIDSVKSDASKVGKRLEDMVNNIPNTFYSEAQKEKMRKSGVIK